MLTTDTATFDLGGTATYASRVCEWVPVGVGAGLLVIRLRKTTHGKEQASCYAVEEQVSGHPDVREFLLENPNNPEQGDAYRITLGGGLKNPCTCDAGKARKHCKHWDALAKLVKEGAV